ncbi:alpha/beta hydrolase [Sporichthya polymorpha]|uniref:poly(ethylene terephthalate) hydrolase family protein n=1 Tax=Sporichthya polymorpha TaxID=35751 RepID=UPI000368B911|nr:alpha/beta hydrolase [Sporichthya polymorpha]
MLTFGLALAVAGPVIATGVAVPAPSSSPSSPPSVEVEPRSPVEDRYRATGPWAVTTSEVAIPDGLSFSIAHPRALGRDGTRHPILVWGNGTNATPDQYGGVFRHLASWGFVVIGSSDTQQADGRTMLAALRHLLGANLDGTSPFFGVLDPTRVGTLGHSQGAGGAINAANGSGGLVDTVVPINLPDARYVERRGRFSVSDLTTPTFFLGGGTDGLISTPGGLRGYYQRVPHGALGVLRGADHLAIQRNRSGYLGYLTAWLRWHLLDDAYAASAFLGVDPKQTEFRRNSRWQNQQAKGLAP